MSYTNNTVIINDLTLADAIHVHTRSQLTTDELRELENIAGITGYNASSKLTTSINVKAGFSRSYTNSVQTGRAFTFEELAPQVILVFADALGISLDQLDLRVEQGGTRQEHDGSSIVEAARKLRKPPTERNPRFAHAATLDDVVCGVELLTVGTLPNNSTIQHFTPNGKTRTFQGSLWVPDTSPDGYVRCGERSLVDMGIVALTWNGGSNWNPGYITIVNTTENRRKLVEWLLTLGIGRPTKIANTLLRKYPTDFTATVTVKDSKLTAEVI
ncbi:MAG: hypothetical protein WBP12_02305 [Candidatus Saccharimonas sp.]